MARRSKPLGQDERLAAFASRLNRLMLERGWSGADLAREAAKHAPRGTEIGRHLVSAYSRAANAPTDANLKYISKALGVKPEELLPPMPGEGESRQYASATSTLDGKTRLVVDAEVDAETALKVLQLVRISAKKHVA
jgi:transcriptional regulator with XRE-family HTH domain